MAVYGALVMRRSSVRADRRLQEVPRSLRNGFEIGLLFVLLIRRS